jgi:P27 family predicted phage terminase small subunit
MVGSWRVKERENEPQRITDPVGAPDWISEMGRAVWDNLYPMLYRMGYVSAIEQTSLGMVCQRVGDWYEAQKKCRDRGRDLPIYDNNGEVISAKAAPWDVRERALYKQALDGLREFGLTASSRSTLMALVQEEAVDTDKIT